jgi:hypothetical protein
MRAVLLASLVVGCGSDSSHARGTPVARDGGSDAKSDPGVSFDATHSGADAERTGPDATPPSSDASPPLDAAEEPRLDAAGTASDAAVTKFRISGLISNPSGVGTKYRF